MSDEHTHTCHDVFVYILMNFVALIPSQIKTEIDNVCTDWSIVYLTIYARMKAERNPYYEFSV